LSDTSKGSCWFLEKWAEARDEGLVPYIVITANRLQMSKTALSMRIGEKVMEEVEGGKYDCDQMSFENHEFMEKWEKFREWTPCILDEPNRPAGNRSWHTQSNQALAEWLQTRAFEHRPSLFPLPHEHLLDNAITAVATSHMVVDRRGHCFVYEYQRDQLNRTYRTRTPYLGQFTFDRPYAWDWAEYMKRRTAYTRERGQLLKEKVLSIDKQAASTMAPLSVEEVASIIAASPDEYMLRGDVSPSMVRSKLKVSYAKAQQATTDYKLMRKETEKAEEAS